MTTLLVANVNFGLDVVKTVVPSVSGIPQFSFPSAIAPKGVISYATGGSISVADEYIQDLTLVSNALTIDLTALVQSAGDLPNLNMTGLKLKLLKITGDAANSATVTMKVGASNGYDPFPTARVLEIGAGDTVMMQKLTTGSVGSSNKNIDFASTMAAAIIHVQMIFG